jgi:hypothetical protein
MPVQFVNAQGRRINHTGWPCARKRQCATHCDTAAFWGRADMPTLGLVWRC